MSGETNRLIDLAKQISEIEGIGWKNTAAMEDYKTRGMI